MKKALFEKWINPHLFPKCISIIEEPKDLSINRLFLAETKVGERVLIEIFD